MDLFADDWDNRLTQATVGGTTVDYATAGDGLRASRATGGATTDFLWDREAGLPQLVQETTGASATSYLHGPTGLLETLDGSGAPAFPLADGLGSIRLVTDGSGAIAGTADYDAWGNLQASSGASTSLGWDGELRDPVTGQVYLRARDYSPGTGRFTSRDTVQPNAPGSQGWNPYASAANNPVTFTDPSGQFLSNFFGSLTFSLTSGFSGAAALGGEGPPLAGLGAVIFGSLAEVVMVLLVVAFVAGLAIWCAQHGAKCGEAVATIAMIGGLTLGFSWLSFIIAGGAVATCAAGIDIKPPFGFLSFISNCPKLPVPTGQDIKCTGQAAADAGMNIAVDYLGGGWGGVAGGGIETVGSAVGTYISCRTGETFCSSFMQAVTNALGGVYLLRDPVTGQVRRTGRTNDFARRRREHARNPETAGLQFEEVYWSADPDTRRGLEQKLYDQYPEADLNGIRPVAPSNPNAGKYQRAADEYLDKLRKCKP